jgi:hypothetical protein
MSLTEFLAKLRRYDQNANIIFDDEEPIGRATDLVMPRRRWFESPASPRKRGTALRGRRNETRILPPLNPTAAPKRS